MLLATVVTGALNRDVSSITDAVVMVATIVAWSFITDILSNRVPFLRRLVFSAPVEVVRDGLVLPRNLRREFMTTEELQAQLRLQGVENEPMTGPSGGKPRKGWGSALVDGRQAGRAMTNLPLSGDRMTAIMVSQVGQNLRQALTTDRPFEGKEDLNYPAVFP